MEYNSGDTPVQLPENFAERNEEGHIWLSPDLLAGYILYCNSLGLDADVLMSRDINSDAIAPIKIKPAPIENCYVFRIDPMLDERFKEEVTIPTDRFPFMEHYFTSNVCTPSIWRGEQ